MTDKTLNRWFAIIALIGAIVILSGCSATVHIPKEAAFDPRPVQTKMSITWVVSENPTAECKRLFPKQMGFHPVIPACAGWSFEAQECVIVTGKTSTHQILGHEIRHCFEGAFH